MYLNLDNPIAERKTKTVYKDGDKTIKLFNIKVYVNFYFVAFFSIMIILVIGVAILSMD